MEIEKVVGQSVVDWTGPRNLLGYMEANIMSDELMTNDLVAAQFGRKIVEGMRKIAKDSMPPEPTYLEIKIDFRIRLGK